MLNVKSSSLSFKNVMCTVVLISFGVMQLVLLFADFGCYYNKTVKAPEVGSKHKYVNRKFITVPMENCNCSRKIELPNQSSKSNTSQVVHFNETSCSLDAFARGLNQRVISLALFGKQTAKSDAEKAYFDGIKGNLDLLPDHYPGFTMRVYYDRISHDSEKKLCELACNNNLIDLCNAKRIPGVPMKDATNLFPMLWRFFPTLDPQVGFLHVRDLDSRFSAREAAAVLDFQKSDKPLHCMRDHKAHGAQILGGMWGTRLNPSTRKLWKKSWVDILKDQRSNATSAFGGPDQQLLAAYVWKNFGGPSGCLQHDSYLCKRYPGSVPWPTKRPIEPNNYVGSVVVQNYTMKEKCPVECRPKDHKDWEYC